MNGYGIENSPWIPSKRWDAPMAFALAAVIIAVILMLLGRGVLALSLGIIGILIFTAFFIRCHQLERRRMRLQQLLAAKSDHGLAHGVRLKLVVARNAATREQ